MGNVLILLYLDRTNTHIRSECNSIDALFIGNSMPNQLF